MIMNSGRPRAIRLQGSDRITEDGAAEKPNNGDMIGLRRKKTRKRAGDAIPRPGGSDKTA